MNASSPSNPSYSVQSATSIGLLAILFWSASVGLIRTIAEALGPTGGAAVIFTTSGLLVCLVRGLPRLSTFNPIYLFVGGLLFVAYEVCLSLSIGFAHNRSQAMELGMINYLWPCLTILLAVLCGQQKGSLMLIPGAALSFLGIVWVMKGSGDWSPKLFASNLQDNATAYGLAFAAAFLWAMYSVLTRRFGGGKSGVAWFLLATAAVLWTKYALGDEPPIAITLESGVQVLVLSMLTATGYSCWNFGVQHGRIAVLAAASYFTPVLSVLLASLWLRTQPSVAFWQGVVMVTAGSLVCWRATRLPR